MSLVDLPDKEITISDIVRQIREEIGIAVTVADGKLLQVRNLVRQYGQVAISAELGPDAAVMLTVYTRLKEAIEAAKEITVEDLPN